MRAVESHWLKIGKECILVCLSLFLLLLNDIKRQTKIEKAKAHAGKNPAIILLSLRAETILGRLPTSPLLIDRFWAP